jgi:hypothetical protein
MPGKRGNPNIREVSKGTRFKPGESGNPGGRAKGSTITALVCKQLNEPYAKDPKMTKGEKFAEVVVDMAVAGDKVWGPLVWRYRDGDPKAASEMSLRELAGQLAERLGLNEDELMATFEREAGAA